MLFIYVTVFNNNIIKSLFNTSFFLGTTSQHSAVHFFVLLCHVGVPTNIKEKMNKQSKLPELEKLYYRF